jgi:hypothetical protein
MFPSRVRYTGFSLAREVTSPISGGIAPMIAVALLAAGHGSPRYVAWYVVALGVITAFSVFMGPETRGRPLDDDPASAEDVLPHAESIQTTH